MQNNNKKILACIQARMGSSRLKGKALKKILGKTLIEHISNRLKTAKEIDGIVLATSINKENDPLAEHAKSIELKYFRGSEDDLISRLLRAAEKENADAVIRITGDCPLVDPDIVDNLARKYRQHNERYNFFTNIFPPSFPHGMDVEIIPVSTLKQLDKEAKKPEDRECLTYYIMKNCQKFKIYNMKNASDQSYFRLTVDYPEDFVLVEKVFESLASENKIFSTPEIIDFLEKNPKLIKINAKRTDSTLSHHLTIERFKKI